MAAISRPSAMASLKDPRVGSFTGDNWKVLLALAGALVTLGFLGYLYFRDWYKGRGFRRRCLAFVDREIVGTGHSSETRKPLVRHEKPALPGNGQWFRSPVAAKSSGILVVQAESEVDELYVDGEFVGMAPARLRLVEGKHVVEVKRAGCKTFRREISVIVGAEVSLRTAFEKERPLGGSWPAGNSNRPLVQSHNLDTNPKRDEIDQYL